MSNYNIQMKKYNNGEWDNLYPFSTTQNIYDKELNKNVDELLSEIETGIYSLTDRVELYESLMNEKTKQIYMLSQLGVDPNSNIDETLINAINQVPSGSTLFFDQNSTYYTTKPLTIEKDVHLDFNGSTLEVNFTNNQGSAIHFLGEQKSIKNITTTYNEGAQSLTLENTNEIEVGDTVLISSTELFNNSRAYYRKGGYFRIENVTSTQIRIHRDMPFSFSSGTGTATIYKPVNGSIKNVTILNKGEINAGTFGIRVERSVNFNIDNVYIDYFNHLILLRSHLNSTVSNFNAGRSFYEGSAESYGLTSYMGTGFTLKNSIIRSGRHAVSITGFEPSFQTLIENCSFDSEDVTNQHAFDCHEANFDLTMTNCTSNGAIFAGNCKITRCRFNNTTGKAVTISKYNDKYQANYIFDACEFAGIELRIGEWQQNPEATANIIGSLVIRDSQAKTGLTLRLNSCDVTNVIIENTDNVALIIYANIEQLKVSSVRFLSDTNFLNHANTESRLKNIIIENSFFYARYRSFLTNSSDTIVLNNVTFGVLAGETVTPEIFNMTSKYIAMNNCHFPSGYAGLVNSSDLVEINGGTNLTITGTNVKRATYA